MVDGNSGEGGGETDQTPPPSGAQEDQEATAAEAPSEATCSAPSDADDAAEIDRAIFLETRETLLTLVTSFIAKPSEPELQGITRFSIQHTEEQRTIRETIFPQFVEHKRTHPIMGLKIWPRGREHDAIVCHVHKDIRKIKDDPRQAFNLVGYLAFLLTPASRALLRALGFDYRFIEVEDKPRLHIVPR